LAVSDEGFEQRERLLPNGSDCHRPFRRSPLMDAGHPVLAVTCLAFEGRIAAGRGVRIFCASERDHLLARIEAAAAGGCCGIVSFGVAGGLDPLLLPGDLVVASAVVTDQGRYRTDEAWARALLAAVPGAVHADISGADAPLTHPADKRALRRAHSTAAVDTESHLAAAVAARRGVPFAAVRVVLDPAHRSLPPATLVPLRRDGRADIGAVLASVRREPAQMPDLLRIVADVAVAWSTLARGRRRLGHALAFPGAVAPEREEIAAEAAPVLAQSVAGSG
jgi:hopanoid-associated phosphorylase